MYYPCSENKDADQLRGYREADLRLCFRPCKLLVFSRTGSNIYFVILFTWNVSCTKKSVFDIYHVYKQVPLCLENAKAKIEVYPNNN